MTNPSDCTDLVWLYSAELDATSADSPLPADIQLSIDSDSNTVSWDSLTANGGIYDPSFMYGVYTILVTGTLMDAHYTS